MSETKQYDEDEFSSAYDRYADMIFKIAAVRLQSVHDAEDVVQDVFVKYMYDSPEFISEEHKKSWIIRVTINMCSNLLKSFWNSKVTSVQELEERGFSVSDKIETECLLDLFRLPAKHRTVLYLFYYEGFSIKEIADLLGQKERSVSSLLSRARRSLKGQIEDVSKNGGEYT